MMMMECKDAPLLMAAFMSITLLIVNGRREIVGRQKDGKEPEVSAKFLTVSLLSIIANWVIVLYLPSVYSIVQKGNLVVMAMTLSRHCLADHEPDWLAVVPLAIVVIKECRKNWVLWIILLHSHSLSCAMDILKRHGSWRVIVLSCMLTIDDELWKVMRLLDTWHSWKLYPQSVVKIPCSQGHFIAGNGDVLVPMTLILSLGNKLEHHVGHLFGCLLIKLLIGEEPLPALVFTVPSILLFDGVVKMFERFCMGRKGLRLVCAS